MKTVIAFIAGAVLSLSAFAAEPIKKPGAPNIPPKPTVAKKDDKKKAAKPEVKKQAEAPKKK